MITRITLKNFKCFGDERSLNFSSFNVLYGMNGRGKSTAIQSLLLLSQNLKSKDSLINTSLKGSMINLGNYQDVINRNAANSVINIDIESNIDAVLKLSFGHSDVGPTMLKLLDAWSGDKQLISSVGTEQEDSDDTTAEAMSGIKVLEVFKHLKYVSASRRGPVNSEERQDDFLKNDIGSEGERLINALAKIDKSFKNQFEEGLSYILSGASVNVEDDGKSDQVGISIDSLNDSQGFKPLNVGYGYSYIMPIIFQVLAAEPSTTIIIENPEAHLYPGAQSRLVNWIITESVKKNLQIILETHSDHIINGLRIAVKQKRILRSDVMIQYIERHSSSESPSVTMIHVDQNGMLSENPSDFMDEWAKQMLSLI